MEKVTKDGVITIENAKGIDTTVKVVEGMQFDRGYISPYFVTDTEKMECSYDCFGLRPTWSTPPTSSSTTRRSAP